MKSVFDFDWHGKTAVLRTDLNVPLDGGVVGDTARIEAAADTIRHILDAGGGVAVLSHLGRPTEGAIDDALSTRALVEPLASIIGHPVEFFADMPGKRIGAGAVALMENTRFNTGEKSGASELAARYAALGDVFVMDAFASAHRSEASITALAAALPACAGILLARELAALDKISGDIARPLIGVFGGAKISTKLAVLRRMGELCDALIIGGGIANTLLAAQGKPMGRSLVQPDMLDEASALMMSARSVLLPTDAIVAKDADGDGARCIDVEELAADEMILDIGEKSSARFRETLLAAKTIIWNGPPGLFEKPPFARGTGHIAAAIADASAFSLIGGGDTIAAARHFGVTEKMSYISTGGGALLEYLACGDLPGLEALRA